MLPELAEVAGQLAVVTLFGLLPHDSAPMKLIAEDKIIRPVDPKLGKHIGYRLSVSGPYLRDATI